MPSPVLIVMVVASLLIVGCGDGSDQSANSAAATTGQGDALDVQPLFETLSTSPDIDDLRECPATDADFASAAAVLGPLDARPAHVTGAANSSTGAATLRCSWGGAGFEERRVELVVAAGDVVSVAWLRQLTGEDFDGEVEWSSAYGGELRSRSRSGECDVTWVGSGVMISLGARVMPSSEEQCDQVEQLFVDVVEEIASRSASTLSAL